MRDVNIAVAVFVAVVWLYAICYALYKYELRKHQRKTREFQVELDRRLRNR